MIPNFTEASQWGMKNVDFGTSAAIISVSSGSHVAISRHLQSFLSTSEMLLHSTLLFCNRKTESFRSITAITLASLSVGRDYMISAGLSLFVHTKKTCQNI